jgi:hypothetical protein
VLSQVTVLEDEEELANQIVPQVMPSVPPEQEKTAVMAEAAR